MMDSKVNRLKPILRNGSVGRTSRLPILGNRILQSQVPQMSVQKLKQLLNTQSNNLVLIDVRNRSEYKIAQLPGLVLIPYLEIQSVRGIAKIKQLLEDKRQESPDNDPHFIVICFRWCAFGKSSGNTQGIRNCQYQY